MSSVRIIRFNGEAAFAVVPIHLWNHFSALAEVIEAAEAKADAAGTTSANAAVSKNLAPPLDRITELVIEADAKQAATMGRAVEAARSAALRTGGLPQQVREDLSEEGMHPLKAWRLYRRMTTKELGAKASVSTSYITLIETGRRPGTRDVVDRLSAALDTPVAALGVKPSKRRGRSRPDSEVNA
ncbi:helix-turn-helix domain-containing protein [Paraburkholderia hospita]|uniref:helix-turn-helix domain-containing protein n=1 Tax=Paraburkholderia hospita TaxID=169430 RepID=UPI0008A793E9|nr:helix-turn-helix transcriptional regulator [Paraburkholderia hospita]SEI14917.1 Helix-turn-helix domain-containing protein [Paraburkholderia hospita]